MSDAPAFGTTMSILKEVMNAWVNRNELKAARGAGQLTFWRDGMLHQIEAIARGEITETVVEGLKQNFEESRERVGEAIKQLKEIRSKIGPSAVGRQVDLVINHAEYGKTGIRVDIELLISAIESIKLVPQELREMAETSVRTDAKYVVRLIESFNAEVSRLHRLVHGS